MSTVWCIIFTEWWKHQEVDLGVRWGVRGVSRIETKRKDFRHEKQITDPVTGEKITTYYKPGETWGSVFGGMGPSYEECRAECVAMSLCPDFGILQIFGIGDGKEASF